MKSLFPFHFWKSSSIAFFFFSTLFRSGNSNFEKHGCQNSVAMVTSLLTYTSRRLYDVARQILGKVAKFGGPNLNGFEVIQFFSEGGCLNRAKHGAIHY